MRSSALCPSTRPWREVKYVHSAHAMCAASAASRTVRSHAAASSSRAIEAAASPNSPRYTGVAGPTACRTAVMSAATAAACEAACQRTEAASPCVVKARGS